MHHNISVAEHGWW